MGDVSLTPSRTEQSTLVTEAQNPRGKAGVYVELPDGIITFRDFIRKSNPIVYLALSYESIPGILSCQ